MGGGKKGYVNVVCYDSVCDKKDQRNGLYFKYVPNSNLHVHSL